MKKEDFYDSMDRFARIDGDAYKGYARQLFNLKEQVCLEWRTHEATGKMHIIQYYSKGKGYTIYKSE